MTVNLHTLKIRKRVTRQPGPRLPVLFLLMPVLFLLILCSGLQTSRAEEAAGPVRSPAGVLGKNNRVGNTMVCCRGCRVRTGRLSDRRHAR